MEEALLIAGSRNPVLADYVTHCHRRGRNVCVVCAPEVGRKIAAGVYHPAGGFSAAHSRRPVGGVVLFLDRQVTERDRALFEEVIEVAREKGARRVCVVSSFRVHFGDRAAARAEGFLLELLAGLPARVVVLRPSHVISRHSPLGAFLRASWLWSVLLPADLRGCCVEGEELFAAIDRELTGPGRRRCRTLTLLGENKPWRDRLLEHARGWLPRACVAIARALPPLAAIRHAAGLFLNLVGGRVRQLKPWHVQTLRPGSVDELLTLYNPYNYRHVKVVGYNNGVVHFGQKHPGKTVVSTVGCNRRAWVRGDVAGFDAGVTVRQAADVLGAHGKELHVLPNYSYVSLGTGYFIPIHGSASKFSTVAETIEKVLLYDPARDRFLALKREDRAFGEYVYNLGADVLLLRLRLRVKDRSRYYVKDVERVAPSAQEILGYFHAPGPSNVEVRKAGSAATAVKVSQYYTTAAAGDGAALELPRDAIGRVWDRLEENPVSSALFHGLVRRFAYHVELFLSEEEFVTFWETHGSLPIHKIQLRFIRRDGFANSPFREHDRISADLFMLKKHREAFDAYVKATLPAARMNPGKHSM